MVVELMQMEVVVVERGSACFYGDLLNAKKGNICRMHRLLSHVPCCLKVRGLLFANMWSTFTR